MAAPNPTICVEDYFCDTNNQNVESQNGSIYLFDQLWDGNGCGPTSACCTFSNPPFCPNAWRGKGGGEGGGTLTSTYQSWGVAP